MNICNHELIWLITWNFSIYYCFAKWTKCIFKRHQHLFPYIGYKFYTHRCECVGNEISSISITKEQVSRNLRIGPMVLEKKIFNFVNVFLLFRNYLPLEKGVRLHLSKLESLHPRMLCAKFGWITQGPSSDIITSL